MKKWGLGWRNKFHKVPVQVDIETYVYVANIFCLRK